LTPLGRQAEPTVRRFVAWGEWFCGHAGLDYDAWLVSMGTKWKIWIWYHLLDGTRRFGELQRLLPGVSRQVLAMELRGLEQMSVLHRHTSAEGPLKVEYALTDLGQRSGPILRELIVWGRAYCEQVGIAFEWPVTPEVEGRAAMRAELTADIAESA
ncbi:MAG TPA: winged helix-turn-helix transcriptional regulator, partial [Ktedonobacterales bacterium]|nr:winged helix-turn-helix transcriptional regulator [Ktedonobacterales bacterium]